MKYKRLFRLELKHSYHASGACTDFALVPVANTAATLRRQRMRMRTSPAGLEVIVELKADDAPVAPIANTTVLQFGLQLQNRAFVQYTDVPAISALTAQQQLDGDKKWRLFTNDGLASDAYELTATELVTSRTQIPDYQRSWAVVNIVLNSQVTDQAPTYTVSFSPPTAVWRYYVLTEPTAANYQVVDGGAELSFSKTDLLAEAQPDELSQRLLDQYPDAAAWLFEADTPLPYTQLGRKNLNLQKDGATVIEHLPVPTSNSRGIQVIKTFV